MSIVQIAALGIISVILTLTIKKENPQISILISIAAGIIIFANVVPRIEVVLDIINEISNKFETQSKYVKLVIKIIGIAYISQFASQICIDAGERAISSKIELAGKVMIMVIAAPVLLSIIELIENILP